ncbi:hypothetical protein pdam_00014346 [Pocillopora damicornis]|uniref:Uncharacterized protein n=1 Tax=Pocillopora damicornis TaxID=46731 RepID=A0A3M6TFQ8_POCDA|nr:hypothetical protein pdam_00014346 [Pocillopora damicornis]
MPPAVMVSGRYVIAQNGRIPPQPILMEHCCFMVGGNDWDISVKCRPHFNQSKKSKKWRNIKEVYPDAKVETKHNDIRLTLPVLGQSLEVAAFGVPGKDDQKRMQMVIFGKEPAKACDWDIRVYLIDDSEMAFKKSDAKINNPTEKKFKNTLKMNCSKDNRRAVPR